MAHHHESDASDERAASRRQTQASAEAIAAILEAAMTTQDSLGVAKDLLMISHWFTAEERNTP